MRKILLITIMILIISFSVQVYADYSIGEKVSGIQNYIRKGQPNNGRMELSRRSIERREKEIERNREKFMGDVKRLFIKKKIEVERFLYKQKQREDKDLDLVFALAQLRLK